MTLKKEEVPDLAVKIKNALQFEDFDKWEFIITEIISDQLFGTSFIAYFDGSAKPNPGEMKIGGRILTPDSKNIVQEYSIDIGHGTNNEAEYSSLLQMAEMLVNLKATSVKIYGDSQLVVNQINGLWQVKNDRMRLFHSRTLAALSLIPNWTLEHVFRDQNTEADALTR